MFSCRQIIKKLNARSIRFAKCESGQSLVIAVVAFTVLVACAALAVDLGLSYIVQQKLQTAADEAALAGARAISLSVHDAYGAKEKALDYAELNGAERENTTVTVPYEGDPYRVEVVCTREMNYCFASIIGKRKGTVSARAVAECQTLRGPFDYALFSGSTDYEFQLNTESTVVTGDVHSNDDLAMRSGRISVDGDIEAVDQLHLGSGGLTITGGKYAARIDQNGRVISEDEKGRIVDMPDFSDIVKEAARQAGNYYTRSTSFNSSSVNVDEPIYVEGDISFNTPTVISGSGIIIATGNITFSAGTVLSPSSSVCFYSKNGNISIWAGEITVSGLLYAPNGTIQAGTSKLTVNGRVVANKLQINSSQVTITQGEHDRDCLPRLEIALIE